MSILPWLAALLLCAVRGIKSQTGVSPCVVQHAMSTGMLPVWDNTMATAVKASDKAPNDIYGWSHSDFLVVAFDRPQHCTVLHVCNAVLPCGMPRSHATLDLLTVVDTLYHSIITDHIASPFLK